MTAPSERTLASGLRLVVERRPGARVAIEVAWPRAPGASTDGGAAVAAAAIEAGCAAPADRDGGTLTARAGRTALVVRGSWPREAWRDGLNTAWACPRSPAVTTAMPAARERLIADHAHLLDSPGRRAVAVAARARWGPHGLGAEPHPLVTTALGLAAVRALVATQLGQAPVIALVGDVDIDEVARALVDAGPWSAAPAPPPVAPPPPATGRQVFVEQPGPRAAIAIALPGLAADHPDRAALDLLTAWLVDPSGPLADASAGGRLSAAVLDDDDAAAMLVLLETSTPIAPRATALAAALTAAAHGPDPVVVEALRARLLTAGDRPAARAATLAHALIHGVADPRPALTTIDAVAVNRVAAALLRWDQAVLATVQPPNHAPAVERLRATIPGRRTRVRPGPRPAPARPRVLRRRAR